MTNSVAPTIRIASAYDRPRHPLARVHPLERRAPARGLFLRPRPSAPYVREFRVA